MKANTIRFGLLSLIVALLTGCTAIGNRGDTFAARDFDKSITGPATVENLEEEGVRPDGTKFKISRTSKTQDAARLEMNKHQVTEARMAYTPTHPKEKKPGFLGRLFGPPIVAYDANGRPIYGNSNGTYYGNGGAGFSTLNQTGGGNYNWSTR